MGLEVLVACDAPPPLDTLLARLAAASFPSRIVMVDGQLVAPKGPAPSVWRDVRLSTPAGTVTLARRPTGVAVVAFGNADAALKAAQERVADTLRSLAAPSENA